jgi:hypothetical protein
MISDVLTVSPEITTLEALRMMIVKGFDQLPVLEGNRLVGMVSWREIGKNVVLKKKDPRKKPHKTSEDQTRQFHRHTSIHNLLPLTQPVESGAQEQVPDPREKYRYYEEYGQSRSENADAVDKTHDARCYAHVCRGFVEDSLKHDQAGDKGPD